MKEHKNEIKQKPEDLLLDIEAVEAELGELALVEELPDRDAPFIAKREKLVSWLIS